MLEQLDSDLAAALARVHQVIDTRTHWVHVERREMVESARRSLGQRIRWARAKILGPRRWGMGVTQDPAYLAAQWQLNEAVYRRISGAFTRTYTVPGQLPAVFRWINRQCAR